MRRILELAKQWTDPDMLRMELEGEFNMSEEDAAKEIKTLRDAGVIS